MIILLDLHVSIRYKYLVYLKVLPFESWWQNVSKEVLTETDDSISFIYL